MKKTISLLILLFIFQIVSAQDFQGEAVYKTSRKVDIQLDSTQMNSDQHKMMMDMVKKQFHL